MDTQLLYSMIFLFSKQTWNTDSRKFKTKENYDFIPGKTTSHNYATNLISNKIEAGTKFEYIYKINDELSFNSNITQIYWT